MEKYLYVVIIICSVLLSLFVIKELFRNLSSGELRNILQRNSKANIESLFGTSKTTFLALMVSLITISVSSLVVSKQIEDVSVTNSKVYVASLLDKKEQCMRVGSEVHNRISAEFSESDLDATILRPEYTYNPRLDTCLYSSGSVSGTDGNKVIVQKWVMDSFSNEELLGFTSFDGRVTGLSAEEFDSQKEKLFAETQ